MIRILTKQIPASGRRLTTVERQRLQLMGYYVDIDTQILRISLDDWSCGVIWHNHHTINLST